jgi:glycosyltransferase involved in cell wall biosynthesis
VSVSPKKIVPREEPIKVLHLISSKGLYGAERVVMTLARHADPEQVVPVMGIFRKRGTGGDEFVREAEGLGIAVETIPYTAAFDVSQLLNLYKVVKRHRPRIIHTHEYKTNILGFIVAKTLGIPIVTIVHALHKLKGRAKVELRISVWLLRYLNAVMPVSEEVRDELLDLGVPQNKTVTIKNVPPLTERRREGGVRSFREELDIPSNQKLIGFLGRLIPAKGCDQLIHALSLMDGEHRDSILTVVGEGPEEDSLRDPENVYASLDLLVLPSREEGTPLVMLEGMWQEVPVVASRVGGIPEVIEDRVNGLLVPWDDPAALAEAITESLGMPDEARKRAQEARKKMEREYDVKAYVEKVQDVYKGIVP